MKTLIGTPGPEEPMRRHDVFFFTAGAAIAACLMQFADAALGVDWFF